MASKGGRDKIKLESTAGTGHFYTTTKNKKTTPDKMVIMKFDPKARKHVEYKDSTLVVTSRQAGRGSRDDLVNHKNMANYKRK